MAITERGSSFYKRTIGSESFENFSRTPLALLIAALGIILGPNAIIEAVNQINETQLIQGVTAATQGTLEIGVAVAIGVANIRSRRKIKPPSTS